MLGVQETKEALHGVNRLVIEIAKLLKDGFQPGADVTAFVQMMLLDGVFKKALLAAQEGADKIPAEMKDLDMLEGIELAKIQIEYVPQLLAALKKDV
jgi:hypothetical protein